MNDQNDPIGRAVDLAFNVHIAGVAFARDFTKFALHRFASTAQDVVAGVATTVAEQRAARGNPTWQPTPPSGEHEDPDATAQGLEATVAEGTDPDGLVAIEVDSLAIAGYDELNARQILALLDGLTANELADVHAYESAQRARRTVLAAVGVALEE